MDPDGQTFDSRIMFNRLSRDYWPPETTYPLLRLGAAFVLAPLIVVAVVLLCLFVLDVAISGEADIALYRVLEYGPFLLVATYALLLALGLPVFLALWTTRLRGRRAFVLSGAIVGLIAALCAPFLVGESVGLVSTLVMTLHFGLVMLMVRMISGVRRVPV